MIPENPEVVNLGQMKNTDRLKNLYEKRKADEKTIKNKSFDFSLVEEHSHPFVGLLKAKNVLEK